jgi:hypothetical protein
MELEHGQQRLLTAEGCLTNVSAIPQCQSTFKLVDFSYCYAYFFHFNFCSPIYKVLGLERRLSMAQGWSTNVLAIF